MNVPFQYLPRMLVSEAVLRRRWLVAGFFLVSLAVTAIGVVWPKTYTASATVYIEERNIIQPLMKGAAVATTVTDRAKIAREIIFRRRILGRVVEDAGWLEGNLSERERGQIMDGVKNRTRVMNVGGNLVRIEYQDEIPERAYVVAQGFAELFIEESAANQTRESNDAFEFIDGQVKVYHAKLTQAEQALKEFRSQHLDARPGTEAEIASKISTLKASIEKTKLDLKEAQIRKASLERQLSGEAVIATSLTREGQYVARIAELQTQLDTLRLNYHDTYPDVVRLEHQITELRELAEKERHKRERAGQAIRSGDLDAVDETVRATPIYQRLRTELLDTKTNIETLTARLGELRQMLEVEEARAKKLYGGEAVLAELTRDYEVNRDIYHDLLKRRENARVSRNLDANQHGLAMRLHEPAVLPTEPSGMRFMHFAAAGLILGLGLPVGLLVALQHIDPRLRAPGIVTERMGLPVLAVVPRAVMISEVRKLERSLNRIVLVVLLTLAIVAYIGALKFTGRL